MSQRFRLREKARNLSRETWIAIIFLLVVLALIVVVVTVTGHKSGHATGNTATVNAILTASWCIPSSRAT
jgi:flagellar basal body-associated protein FliL